MPLRLELSDLAAFDLQEITRYGVEQFGRRQADEYLSGLFEAFDILTANPFVGREVSAGGIRRLVYRMHLVFYRPFDDRLRILHVRQGTRAPIDADQFFADL